MLTRDMIALAQDFDKEKVEVPEWGGHIFVRSMSVHGADEMNRFYLRIPDVKKLQTTKGKKQAKIEDIDISSDSAAAMIGMMTEMISHCICDESGALLFDDDEGKAILNTKSHTVVERIYNAAMRVNKMDVDTMEQEKKESPTTNGTVLNSSSV